MGTLIGIEIKKLLFRKKTLITTIAFLLLIGLVAFGTYKEDENREKWSNPDNQIKNMEESVNSMKENMKKPNVSEDEKKRMAVQITDLEQNMQQLKNKPKLKDGDWKKELHTINSDLERDIKQSGMEQRQKDNTKLLIEKNVYLINHNIKPEDESLNAFKFMEVLFEGLGFIFLAVGVGLFTADMVSGECTPPTLKLLLTQPVSRAKVLLSKFIAVVTSATIMIIVIELLSFLIMGLIFGFGSSNYPMQVGTKYQWDMTQVTNGTHPLVSIAGSTYIITRGVFIVKMFLLQILAIVAVAGFAFMLSSIFKSSMVSVSLSIVTPVVLFIISQIQSLSKFNIFMFTNHLNPINIMQGSLATRFNNPMLTPAFSIILLATWTVVCYAISHLVFTKKDILI